MVLPVRIELTTSPLPRECSTTELRQRAAVGPRAPQMPRFMTYCNIGVDPSASVGPHQRWMASRPLAA